MDQLLFRQIHLDFHTSEKIEGIGKDFNKQDFQDALTLGHVNSINIFAKCHHGWSYDEDTIANEKHPYLTRNLLREMVCACREINVQCPIYISAGLDEKIARRHPEWLLRNKDESTTWAVNFAEPGYHMFCMNSPYLDYLKGHVREIVETYDCDGLWLDIVGERICYCQNCVKTALELGYNPENEEDMKEVGKRTFRIYAEAMNEIAGEIPIFHNNGHIARGRYDLMELNSHLEIESLPTGGWGYDHFPLSARYLQNINQEYLGMTGKFHLSWGEFGGFKHPDALRYECSLGLAVGAKLSIGDQLHPFGKLDPTTYELIGKAYQEVEQKEPFCVNSTNVAQIAFLSVEACLASGHVDPTLSTEERNLSDFGALRVLQEGHYLFDIIDTTMPFSAYQVLILPDLIQLDLPLQQKLTAFIAAGGKILSTGDSGKWLKQDAFGIDLGVQFDGVDWADPSFCRPLFNLKDLSASAFVVYSKANKVLVSSEAEILAYHEASFFNRTTFQFSSHFHTPNNPDDTKPAIVQNSNGIYVPWKLFKEYATRGELAHKQILLHLIDCLLGEEKVLSTDLPPAGIVTLRKQKNRQILHLLYATPIKKGTVEVVEGIPTLAPFTVRLKTTKPITAVYEAVSKRPIPYSLQNQTITFQVEGLNCHQMVVIE